MMLHDDFPAARRQLTSKGSTSGRRAQPAQISGWLAHIVSTPSRQFLRAACVCQYGCKCHMNSALLL